MDQLAVMAVGAGIGLYVVSKEHSANITPSGTPPNPPKPLTPIQQRLSALRANSVAALPGQSTKKTAIATSGGAGVQVDNAIAQARAALEAKAKAEYNALSCDAKKAGAKAMKAKYPDIKLDPSKACDMSYEDLAGVVGGSVGAAVCNAVPGVGTLASPLCAIAGSYLGVKIEEWVAKHWNEVEDWVQDKAGDVADAVEDAAKKVIDTVGGWF